MQRDCPLRHIYFGYDHREALPYLLLGGVGGVGGDGGRLRLRLRLRLVPPRGPSSRAARARLRAPAMATALIAFVLTFWILVIIFFSLPLPDALSLLLVFLGCWGVFCLIEDLWHVSALFFFLWYN